MFKPKSLAILTGAAASAFVAMTSAHASLMADGITYTLTETATADPLTDQFTLGISGINGPTDTEGGRSGVEAIAFTQPANFLTAVMIAPPTGYTYEAGGLNSTGCDGHGNFYCFDANSPPPTSPAFPANSTLSFTFDVTLSSGSFAGYIPDFKINWVGSQSNPPHSGYDLVSESLAPTPGTTPPPSVPEPASLALLGAALAGLGVLGRRKPS